MENPAGKQSERLKKNNSRNSSIANNSPASRGPRQKTHKANQKQHAPTPKESREKIIKIQEQQHASNTKENKDRGKQKFISHDTASV